MHLQFTDEQIMMRDMVRQFAQEKFNHGWSEWKRENFHVSFYSKWVNLA